eukprot:jgi/Tetstr1/465751/TSEL_010376.t1
MAATATAGSSLAADLRSARLARRSGTSRRATSRASPRCQAASSGGSMMRGPGEGSKASALKAVMTDEPRTTLDEAQEFGLPEMGVDQDLEGENIVYDAVVIGSGMGGLATAARLTEAGAKVIVLEKYLVPGGSAAAYEREGFKFDVGSSMMFGLGDKGETNLLTRALASVGKSIESVPDPTQIHYHLPASDAHPDGLQPKVWRDYEEYMEELVRWFPHEEAGIRSFYGECWKLAAMAPLNTGAVARKYISDPELLSYIDMECFCWSTGGVGRLAELLAEGIEERGGRMMYRANVKKILPAPEAAFLKKFKKSPSFFTMHLGVKADLLPADCQCHHIVLEDWTRLEDAHGTLFCVHPHRPGPPASRPTARTSSTPSPPDYIDNWKFGTPQEYEAEKEAKAAAFIQRLEAVFPGLSDAIVLQGGCHPANAAPLPKPRRWDGVNAVVFSGFGCAHRVLCDIGMEKSWPLLDTGLNKMLSFFRQR